MFGILNLNIIAFLFTVIAIALLLFATFILVIWMWRGGDGILFPGLGIIVSTPGFVVLLLILAIGSVIAAGITKPKKDTANSSGPKQNFEYPNDIFSGCGNGTLTLSLAQNPAIYNEKTDRSLKICINYDDLESVQDMVIKGRIDYANLENNEKRQKAIEFNRELFQKFSSQYPMLGRVNDMYEDYSFTPEEIPQLREECLKLRSEKPNPAADLALRKFIYACDEALKDTAYLQFTCD